MGPLLSLWPLLVAVGVGLTLLAVFRLRGCLQVFVALAGSSLVGFYVFVLLHNMVYALAYVWLKDMPGGDEPVFFILALVVCPIGFLSGVIGTAAVGVERMIGLARGGGR